MNHKKGFTLLEILLVVGIISILAGIVIVAINPSKQLATVRNTERKSDLKQIDSALTQYYIDNYSYPSDIDGTLTGICNTGSLSTTTGSEIVCTNLVDLTSLVPTYITSIPTDPQSTTTNTGYYIKKDSTTRKIGVQADLAELEQDIVIGMVASGTVPVVTGCTATGGDETTVSGYKIHTFTTVGSDAFTVTSDTCDAEVLVVAGGGGGGGGGAPGGGGGAGGLKYFSNLSASGVNTVIVGAGGSSGYNGESSSFGVNETSGGGNGRDYGSGRDAGSGGSGGGGGYFNSDGGIGIDGEGHNGGSANGYASPLECGGGGGAGGAGLDYTTGQSGAGGVGIPNPISGSTIGENISGVYYLAGGGGGSTSAQGAVYGVGGQGGGGSGSLTDAANGSNGDDNTGGGGGGSHNGSGGLGGSGVVIVRYAI